MKRELTLTLTVDDKRVTALDVRLPRFDATALLAQRQASVAPALLPSVFSICAQAQGAAAAGAISAASGQPLPAALLAGHTLAVKLESVQESLRALCLGLPEALRSPQTEQGAALVADFARAWRDSTAFLARFQKALHHGAHDMVPVLAALTQEVQPVAQGWDVFCTRHVYGASVRHWQCEEDGNVLDGSLPVMRWFERMAEEAPALGRKDLPLLSLAAFQAGTSSLQALIETPYDASAWRRVQQDARLAPVKAHFGNAMAARLWARLVDVAKTLGELLGVENAGMEKADAANETTKSEMEGTAPWIRLHSLGDGDGMAEIECARGVLVHRAQLAQQNIAAYDICAPTDWNLHRDGALTTLIGQPAADVARLRTHATWLVQVLDPCVVFDIEVVHA